MRPYKLKHLPTGLYYQPFKQHGSNFSKRGKVYQTKSNILNNSYYSNKEKRSILTIFTYESTLIYKEFKDILNWEKAVGNNNYKIDTLVEDWIIEEL